MAKSNHIHKFRRDSYSTGRKFYYCINGNCTFKCDVKHSLGKETLCNNCGDSFAMNEYSIRMAKPKCMNCVKRRTIKTTGDNDANPMERRELFGGDSSKKKAEVNQSIPGQNSVDDLKNRISNLTIKEYNPDDEL